MSLLAATLIAFTGCGPEKRSMSFASPDTPVAITERTRVLLDHVGRRPDVLVLSLAIDNDAEQPLVFARDHAAFGAAQVAGGGQRTIGTHRPRTSRFAASQRYVVQAGEVARLELEFRSPGIDRRTGLTLELAGTADGAVRTWRLDVPAETAPSNP